MSEGGWIQQGRKSLREGVGVTQRGEGYGIQSYPSTSGLYALRSFYDV